MSDHDLIEIAARTAFSHEQCDRRQAALLADNWNQRLSDGDRAEYRALASAILANVEPIIRADERERIANDGLSWVAERERERIAQACEARADVARDQAKATGSARYWEAAEAYEAAAESARNGGRDA